MDRSAPPLSVKGIFPLRQAIFHRHLRLAPLLYWLTENGIPLGKWLKFMVN